MPSIELNETNFKETYEKNDIVVIDFWAPWCGPCQAFGPIFEEVSDQVTDVKFGKVNTEVEQGIAAYFQIRSIPTLIIIRDGIELFRHSGMVSANDLGEIVKKVKEVDMEEVERLIKEEEEKQH